MFSNTLDLKIRVVYFLCSKDRLVASKEVIYF